MSAWSEIILNSATPADVWAAVFKKLREVACATASPVELHDATIEPDRLLAEAAWDLWQQYPSAAHHTSQALRDWWCSTVGQGRAILILDGVSLRELFIILQAAQSRQITPTRIDVTGAEIPSDSNAFAKSLGISGRHCLANSGAPSGFCFAADSPWTDVQNHPFEDAAAAIPPQPNVIVWHTWLDDFLEVPSRKPDQVYRVAEQELQGDGFWKFVDRLRQGRRLVVTADHGYAVAKSFVTRETDHEVVLPLRETFGASRYKPASTPWNRAFMPPVVFTHSGHHVVMGQRSWTIQGGFPFLCHGGMSLLEVAVPFIELPPL